MQKDDALDHIGVIDEFVVLHVDGGDSAMAVPMFDAWIGGA